MLKGSSISGELKPRPEVISDDRERTSADSHAVVESHSGLSQVHPVPRQPNEPPRSKLDHVFEESQPCPARSSLFATSTAFEFFKRISIYIPFLNRVLPEPVETTIQKLKTDKRLRTERIIKEIKNECPGRSDLIDTLQSTGAFDGYIEALAYQLASQKKGILRDEIDDQIVRMARCAKDDLAEVIFNFDKISRKNQSIFLSNKDSVKAIGEVLKELATLDAVQQAFEKRDESEEKLRVLTKEESRFFVLRAKSKLTANEREYVDKYIREILAPQSFKLQIQELIEKKDSVKLSADEREFLALCSQAEKLSEEQRSKVSAFLQQNAPSLVLQQIRERIEVKEEQARTKSENAFLAALNKDEGQRTEKDKQCLSASREEDVSKNLDVYLAELSPFEKTRTKTEWMLYQRVRQSAIEACIKEKVFDPYIKELKSEPLTRLCGLLKHAIKKELRDPEMARLVDYIKDDAFIGYADLIKEFIENWEKSGTNVPISIDKLISDVVQRVAKDDIDAAIYVLNKAVAESPYRFSDSQKGSIIELALTSAKARDYMSSKAVGKAFKRYFGLSESTRKKMGGNVDVLAGKDPAEEGWLRIWNRRQLAIRTAVRNEVTGFIGEVKAYLDSLHNDKSKLVNRFKMQLKGGLGERGAWIIEVIPSDFIEECLEPTRQKVTDMQRTLAEAEPQDLDLIENIEAKLEESISAAVNQFVHGIFFRAATELDDLLPKYPEYVPNNATKQAFLESAVKHSSVSKGGEIASAAVSEEIANGVVSNYVQCLIEDQDAMISRIKREVKNLLSNLNGAEAIDYVPADVFLMYAKEAQEQLRDWQESKDGVDPESIFSNLVNGQLRNDLEAAVLGLEAIKTSRTLNNAQKGCLIGIALAPYANDLNLNVTVDRSKEINESLVQIVDIADRLRNDIRSLFDELEFSQQMSVNDLTDDALIGYIDLVRKAEADWYLLHPDLPLDVDYINQVIKNVVENVARNDIISAAADLNTALEDCPEVAPDGRSRGYLLSLLLKTPFDEGMMELISQEVTKRDVWLEASSDRQAVLRDVAKQVVKELTYILYDENPAPGADALSQKYLRISDLARYFPLGRKGSEVVESSEQVSVFSLNSTKVVPLPRTVEFAAGTDVRDPTSDLAKHYITATTPREASLSAFKRDNVMTQGIKLLIRYVFGTKPEEIDDADGDQREGRVDEFIKGHLQDSVKDLGKAEEACDSIKALMNQGSIVAIVGTDTASTSFEKQRYLIRPDGQTSVECVLTRGKEKGEFFLATRVYHERASHLVISGNRGQPDALPEAIKSYNKKSNTMGNDEIARSGLTDILRIKIRDDGSAEIAAHPYLGGNMRVLDNFAAENPYPLVS